MKLEILEIPSSGGWSRIDKWLETMQQRRTRSSEAIMKWKQFSHLEHVISSHLARERIESWKIHFTLTLVESRVNFQLPLHNNCCKSCSRLHNVISSELTFHNFQRVDENIQNRKSLRHPCRVLKQVKSKQIEKRCWAVPHGSLIIITIRPKNLLVISGIEGQEQKWTNR